MATREKKELPFTIEAMKQFKNVNDAVKYFQNEVKRPLRTQKITNLFNEAHELNVGPVSLNMAVFKSDPKRFEEFIKRNKLFQSDKSLKIVRDKIAIWQGKPIEREPIEREPIIKQPIESVAKENNA